MNEEYEPIVPSVAESPILEHLPSHTKSKIFASIIILVIAGLGYIGLAKYFSLWPFVISKTSDSTILKLVEPTAQVDTSNWITYTDNIYDFEIKYPPTWFRSIHGSNFVLSMTEEGSGPTISIAREPFTIQDNINSDTSRQIISTLKFIGKSISVDTSNWKTYSSDEYEFKYPPNWEITSKEGEDVHFKISQYNFMFIQSGFFIPAPVTETMEESLNFLKSVGVDGSSYKEVSIGNGKAFLKRVNLEGICCDGPPNVETILASKYYVYLFAYQGGEDSLDEEEKSILQILSTFKFKDIFHITYNPENTTKFYNYGGIKDYTKDIIAYQIEYPKDAQISFVGGGITGTSCTVIRYNSGYVAINKNSTAPCITPEDGLIKDEIGVGGAIVINGKSYPIFVNSNTDNTHVFGTIKINSTITINFGATDNQGAKYFDAIDDVRRIIESFRLYSYE